MKMKSLLPLFAFAACAFSQAPFPGGGGGTSSGTGTVTSIIAGQCLTGGTISTSGTIALAGGVNPETSTYQVLAGDFSACKTIAVASGTFTITLVASGSQPANGQFIRVLNYGSGTVTIAASGQNINGGGASLTMNAGSAAAPTDALVISDATNYFARLNNTGNLNPVLNLNGISIHTVAQADSGTTFILTGTTATTVRLPANNALTAPFSAAYVNCTNQTVTLDAATNSAVLNVNGTTSSANVTMAAVSTSCNSISVRMDATTTDFAITILGAGSNGTNGTNGSNGATGATGAAGASGGASGGYSAPGLTLTAGTSYFPYVGGGLPSATEASSQQKIGTVTAITNFVVTTNAALGSGNQVVWTFRDAAAGTAVTCTQGNTTGCTAGSLSFTTAVNDLLDVQAVATGTFAGTFMVSFTYANGTSNVGLTQLICGAGLSGGTITATGTCATTSPVNAQTGNYNPVAGDQGKLITFASSSAITSAPPVGSTSGFGPGWYVDMMNYGPGLVTITPVTSTINNGAASYYLTVGSGIRIFVDGSNNYQIQSGSKPQTVILSPGNTIASGPLTDYYGIQTGFNATESNVTSPLGLIPTFHTLSVLTRTAQPASGSLVINFRQTTGGTPANCGLTVTIAASAAAGLFQDLTHTCVGVTTSDTYAYQAINNATATSASFGMTVQMQ